MSALTGIGGAGLRASSVMLGGTALGLALAAGTTDLGTADLMDWMARTLGTAFLVLLGALVFVALLAWTKLVQRHSRPDFWIEAGLHAAGAVATLALTFTLLGISLGIGSLAQTALTPETVQGVISDLTRQFSLAFMTSVIGLPVSTGLRALLLLTERAMAPAGRTGPDAKEVAR